jgi:hypothetical protein
MKRIFLGLLAALLAAVMMESASRFTGGPAHADATQPNQIRIGVYDPRAVAIAYAGSPLFHDRLAANRKQYEAAKAANDQAKIKELTAWGQNQQIRLHLQGFAGAPVDDILADVKDELPPIAAADNVQSIGLRPDYTAPGVEVVDVTDDLVKLWSPNEKTLKIIASLVKTAPLPIEQIAKMGPND